MPEMERGSAKTDAARRADRTVYFMVGEGKRSCVQHKTGELYLSEMCNSISGGLSAEEHARLRLEWLWVYEAEVPHCGRWSGDIVVPAGVFFVLAGEARLKVGGRLVMAGPGDAYFGTQGVRRQWFAEGTTLLSVGFRASWWQFGPLLREGLNEAVAGQRVERLRRETKRLLKRVHPARRSIAFKEASAAADRSLKEWLEREVQFRLWFATYLDTLLLLGVRLEHPRLPVDARLATVLRCLDEWPLSRKLEVVEVLRLSGLNTGRRRLEQLMKTHTGLSPTEYLERRRFAMACDELVRGMRPIKELSFDLGFRYGSHFTKWFQRLAGFSPSTYRATVVQAV